VSDLKVVEGKCDDECDGGGVVERKRVKGVGMVDGVDLSSRLTSASTVGDR
jgi:hypothetical protein